MNNFNANDMFNLMNLLGMGKNFNSGYGQNNAQLSSNYVSDVNTAASDSSYYCESGLIKPEKEPNLPDCQCKEFDVQEPDGKPDCPDCPCQCKTYSPQEPDEESRHPRCPCQCGEYGPQEPRGESGAHGPAGPPGHPQNSAFASFLCQDFFLPENASLPLNMAIPDTTQNISPCNAYSVFLAPGYYAISYYVSTVMKRRGFIMLTPIFNNCEQTAYAARAESVKRNEQLILSKYFIAEIPNASMLFFTWDSSASASKIHMNLSIEKLGRQ